MATPRYTALSHTSEDEEEGNRLLSPSSPSAPPSPTASSTKNHTTTTCSLTFHPPTLLRILGLIFSLTAAILQIIRGRWWFIASDIFLLLTVAHNLAQLLYHFCSSVSRISIDYRGRVQVELHETPGLVPLVLKRSGVPLALCVDIVLCFATFVSLISEGAVYRSQVGPYWYYSGDVYDGVIVAYFGLAFQVLLAVPKLDRYTLTVSVGLNPPASQHSRRTERGDVKFAPSVTAPGGGEHQQQQVGVVSVENETVSRSGADMV